VLEDLNYGTGKVLTAAGLAARKTRWPSAGPLHARGAAFGREVLPEGGLELLVQ